MGSAGKGGIKSISRNFSDGTAPKVSIVIPCNDRGRFLPDTMQSLAAQTLGDFEVIVVNDGSKDDSLEVADNLLDEYEGRFPLSVVDKDSEGPGAARNCGFAIARGMYFLPLDSDDRLSFSYLEEVSGLLDDMHDVDIVFTGYRFFGGMDLTHKPPDFDISVLGYWDYIPYCSMFRRNVFERLNGYEPSASGMEDWDFWLRAHAGGFRFKALKKPLLQCRRHETGTKSTMTDMAGLQARLRLGNSSLFDPVDMEWARLTLDTDEIEPYRGRKALLMIDLIYPSVGGMERVAAELGMELTRLGFAVDIATRSIEDRQGVFYYNGMSIYEFDYPSVPHGQEEVDYSAVNSLVRRGNYDFILAAGDPRNWQHWCLDRPEDTRIVESPIMNGEVCAFLEDNPEFKRSLIERLKKAAGVAILSESGYDGEFMLRNDIDFHVVSNATNYESSRRCFRDSMGISQDTMLLLVVGSIYEIKNQLWLVENMKSMPGNWVLVMMGQTAVPDYRDEVVERTRCDRRFVVLGPQERDVVASAMEEADLLLIPSTADAFPLVALEAMSHRLPWVASDFCAAFRKLKGGVTAPLELSGGEPERPYHKSVEEKKARGSRAVSKSPFVQAVRDLLSNPVERRRLADEGFDKWVSDHRWRTVAERYINIIGLGGDPANGFRYRRVLEADAPVFVQWIRDPGLENPLVSVIIPTRNRPDLLKQAIKSVLDQTYDEFEVIVINDHGEDVTLIVKGFSDPRVRYCQNDHSPGPAGARNVGVGLSGGKYVAYLDDDDTYYPNHLETLVGLLESTGHEVAYTDSYRVTMAQENNGWVRVAKELIYSTDFSREFLFAENLMPINCVMHSRAAFDKAGGFDESIGVLEDWELWIRMAKLYEFFHYKGITCEVTLRMDQSHLLLDDWAKSMDAALVVNEKHGGLVYEHRDAISRDVERELSRFYIAKHLSLLDAVQLLEESFIDGVTSPLLSFLCARTYLELGDTDRSRACFENCLKLVPGARETMAGLAELEAVLEGKTATAPDGVCDGAPVLIVVAVHEGGKATRKTFERLAEVTDNYSLIIVNGGLDDGGYLTGLNPAAYLEAQGETYELANLGLAAASGKYVAMVRSNLLVDEEGWLEHAVRFMERRPEVGLVGLSGWHTISEEGSPDYETTAANIKGDPDSVIPTWRFTEVAAIGEIGCVMRRLDFRLDEQYGSMFFSVLDLSMQYIQAGFEVYVENVKLSRPEHRSGLGPPGEGEALRPEASQGDPDHLEQRELFRTKWEAMLPLTRGFRDEGYFFHRVNELARPLAQTRWAVDGALIYAEEIRRYVAHVEKECMEKSDFIDELGKYAKNLEQEIKNQQALLSRAATHISSLEGTIGDMSGRIQAAKQRVRMLETSLQTRFSIRLVDFLKRQLAESRAGK